MSLSSRKRFFSSRHLLYLQTAVLILAPLLIGSVHEITDIVMTGVGLVLLLMLFVYRHSAKNIANIPSFVLVLTVLAIYSFLRLIPVPQGLMDTLIPFLAETRARAGMNTWAPWTTDIPGEAARGFRFLAMAGIFLTAFEIAERRERFYVMMWVMTTIAITFALLYHLHSLLGIPKLYFLYEPKHQHFFIPFPNENQSAGYFMFHFFILLGLAFHSRTPWKINTAALGALLLFVTVVMAGSRSANTIMIVGLIVFLVTGYITTFRKQRSLKVRGLVLWTFAIMFLLALLVFINTYITVYITHFDTRHELKLTVWRCTWDMITENWVAGIGAGYSRSITHYLHNPNWRALPVFAENLVLQHASEWGILFFAIFTATLSYLVIRGLKFLKWNWATTGMVIAALAIISHNMFDFSLEFFGMIVPFMTVLGLMARRISIPSRTVKHHFTAYVPIILSSLALVAFLAVAPWIYSHSLKHSEATVMELSKQKQWERVIKLTDRELHSHPTDYVLYLMKGWAQFSMKKGKPFRWIGMAVWLFPEHHLPHLLAARIFVQAAHLSQAAGEYRQALLRGYRPSSDVMKGIKKQLGRYFVDAIPWESPSVLSRIFGHLSHDERITACKYMMGTTYAARLGCYTLLLDKMLADGFKTDALSLIKQWEELNPYSPYPLTYKIAFALKKHDLQKALSLLAQDKPRSSNLIFAYIRALILKRLGQNQKAMEVLKKAVDENIPSLYTKYLMLKELARLDKDQFAKSRYEYRAGRLKEYVKPSKEELFVYSRLLPMLSPSSQRSRP